MYLSRFRRLSARIGENLARRVPTLPIWRILLGVVLAWYVWNFTHTSLRIHYGLGTGAYDYGLYDQGIWLLSRGEAPFVTLMGRNLFGDHTSFVLLLVAPLYWIVPGAGTLFFLQSVGLAAGAVPVFLLARRRLGQDWMACSLAIAYLAHPAVSSINTEDFHPDAFLPALIGFAIYFASEERWRPYAIAVALMLLVKEDVALVVVPLGVWVAVRRDRLYGLFTVAMGVAFFFFASTLLLAVSGDAFPNRWRIPFGGVGGLVTTALSRPGDLVDYLLADGRPWYLWQVGAPFAFVFLILPEVALLAVLPVLVNIVSNLGYQHQIQYHYTAAIVPLLAMGTAYALGRLRGRLLHGALAVVLASALWTGYLWGDFPFSRAPSVHWTPSHPVAVSALGMLDLVPDDAVVSANYRVTAHMARREQIYMFPNPFSTVYYGYNAANPDQGRRLPAADAIEYVMLRVPFDDQYPLNDTSPSVVWERERGAFELIAQNEYWELWKRR